MNSHIIFFLYKFFYLKEIIEDYIEKEQDILLSMLFFQGLVIELKDNKSKDALFSYRPALVQFTMQGHQGEVELGNLKFLGS